MDFDPSTVTPQTFKVPIKFIVAAIEYASEKQREEVWYKLCKSMRYLYNIVEMNEMYYKEADDNLGEWTCISTKEKCYLLLNANIERGHYRIRVNKILHIMGKLCDPFSYNPFSKIYFYKRRGLSIYFDNAVVTLSWYKELAKAVSKLSIKNSTFLSDENIPISREKVVQFFLSHQGYEKKSDDKLLHDVEFDFVIYLEYYGKCPSDNCEHNFASVRYPLSNIGEGSSLKCLLYIGCFPDQEFGEVENQHSFGEIKLKFKRNCLLIGLLHIIARLHFLDKLDYSMISLYLMELFERFAEGSSGNPVIGNQIENYLNSVVSVHDRRRLIILQDALLKHINDFVRDSKYVGYDPEKGKHTFFHRSYNGEKNYLHLVAYEDNNFITAFKKNVVKTKI